MDYQASTKKKDQVFFCLSIKEIQRGNESLKIKF